MEHNIDIGTSEDGLKDIDSYLSTRTYLFGSQVTKFDLILYHALPRDPPAHFVHLSRWFRHIKYTKPAGSTSHGKVVELLSHCQSEHERITRYAADVKRLKKIAETAIGVGTSDQAETSSQPKTRIISAGDVESQEHPARVMWRDLLDKMFASIATVITGLIVAFVTQPKIADDYLWESGIYLGIMVVTLFCLFLAVIFQRRDWFFISVATAGIVFLLVSGVVYLVKEPWSMKCGSVAAFTLVVLLVISHHHHHRYH